MTTKLCKQTHEVIKLPNLNKEILEVKKRIQLSEGQRKALFEQIESENKRDCDEILRLKKELAHATVELHERRSNVLAGILPSVPPAPPSSTPSSAPCRRVRAQTAAGAATKPTASSAPPLGRMQSASGDYRQLESGLTFNANLRQVLGGGASATARKTLAELVDHLDLQRIDKTKRLDLINYRYKQKVAKLKQLAEKYQELLLEYEAEKASSAAATSAAIIAKEQRNRINAVRVQIAEAEHVRTRYRDIRWRLQEDAARFHSRMLQLERDVQAQSAEVGKIKEINREAVKLRAEARAALHREERQVIAANETRDKQNADGRRMLDARVRELSRLERHGSLKGERVVPVDEKEVDGAEDSETQADDESSSPVDPQQTLKEHIETLKEATGSSCLEEVLEKVKGQTATQVRLMQLRKTKEGVKAGKQRRFDVMMRQLEALKFADDKSNQQNVEEVEMVKGKIRAAKTQTTNHQLQLEHVNEVMTKIVNKLMNTYLCLYQSDEDYAAVRKLTPVELVQRINCAMRAMLEERQATEEEEVGGTTMEELLKEIEERESNWLPEPYSDIVRRTPIPVSGAPTPVPSQKMQQPPAGSDDEEELPTRGFLKRQAQLVVDAKNKRKTMRFPIPKTK